MHRKAIEHLDYVVMEMEAKWGVDRLPHLVPEDLRERFRKQHAILVEVMDSGNEARMLMAAQAMERAWQMLDKVAMENGHLSAADGLWETTMPDGRILSVGKDKRYYKAAQHADVFLTMDEVGKIMCGLPELVIKAKIAFPGAVISKIGPWDPAVGDELPF